MSDEYTGPDRRKESINQEHRFTVLENKADGNRKSLDSLQARFSQFDHEQKAELRTSTQLILEKLEEQEKTRAENCNKHAERTKTLETNAGWVDRWLAALTVAFASAIGWDIYRGK